MLVGADLEHVLLAEHGELAGDGSDNNVQHWIRFAVVSNNNPLDGRQSRNIDLPGRREWKVLNDAYLSWHLKVRQPRSAPCSNGRRIKVRPSDVADNVTAPGSVGIAHRHHCVGDAVR